MAAGTPRFPGGDVPTPQGGSSECGTWTYTPSQKGGVRHTREPPGTHEWYNHGRR